MMKNYVLADENSRTSQLGKLEQVINALLNYLKSFSTRQGGKKLSRDELVCAIFFTTHINGSVSKWLLFLPCVWSLTPIKTLWFEQAFLFASFDVLLGFSGQKSTHTGEMSKEIILENFTLSKVPSKSLPNFKLLPAKFLPEFTTFKLCRWLRTAQLEHPTCFFKKIFWISFRKRYQQDNCFHEYTSFSPC